MDKPTSLRDRVKQWEGFDGMPYPDPYRGADHASTLAGLVAQGVSIGYGCRLPLTEPEADILFAHRWRGAENGMLRIIGDPPTPLGHVREKVVQAMVYQLGERGVRRFIKFLPALHAGDWETAADEMLDSDVARKQPGRWGVLAAIMRTGVAA